MCSTERKPSLVASARSFVVTSFCQSTKAMEPVAPPGWGRAPAKAPMGGSAGGLGEDATAVVGAPEPAAPVGPAACAASAAAAPDNAPSFNTAASEYTPRQAPADRTCSAAC